MKQINTLLIGLLFSASITAQRYGNTRWIASGLDPSEMNSSFPKNASAKTSEADYTQGVFIVNEDWYGHQNSTVNFLTDGGEWVYRIFQKENGGHELGCTTQYGTIYGGKFYFVSKQQQDPGAKTKGSRLAVCDATTMKLIKEFEFIATKTVKGNSGQDSIVSIADGRSYFPVNEHKGYIGTSNGIWLYDSDKMEIGKQIDGSGNPNGSGYGQLYYAQIGTMVRANDYIFAIHQQNGLLVIDPQTDQIVRTLKAPIEKDTIKGEVQDVQRGFGSIVQSKDGNLWISMTSNTSGDGGSLAYMLKLDPYTFQTDTIRIPLKEKGIGSIPNSWYAWTADGFCASKQENKIYWNGQDERGSWFTGYQIFCYDIDKKEFSEVIDITALPGNWRLYGTGFRIHPVTDEIYAFFYHQFQDPTHEIVRIDKTGKVLHEYPLITNYWFPAIPVFPDNEPPVLAGSFPREIELPGAQTVHKLDLRKAVTDQDNPEAAVVKSVLSVVPAGIIDATIHNDSLVISNLTKGEGQATVNLQFNSNGKLLTTPLTVRFSDRPTANEPVAGSVLRFYPNPATDRIHLSAEGTVSVEIFSLLGTNVYAGTILAPGEIDISRLPKGIYWIRMGNGTIYESQKLIKE